MLPRAVGREKENAYGTTLRRRTSREGTDFRLRCARFCWDLEARLTELGGRRRAIQSGVPMKPVKLQLPNSPTVDRYQVQQDGKGEVPRQTVHDGCSGLCVKSVFFCCACTSVRGLLALDHPSVDPAVGSWILSIDARSCTLARRRWCLNQTAQR